MELRRIIPSDITASAIAHVSLLTLVLLFSEVHPFGAVTAEQIPVEIVTPQELAEQQAPPDEPPAENKPAETSRRTPQPDFSLLDKPAAATRTPAGRTACACRAPPQKQAALATPPAAQPQPPSQQAAQPPSQPAAPAYKPPEPDVSIKYQVLLGLPPDLSPLPPAPAQGPQQGRRQFRCAGDRGRRYREHAGRGIPAAPQDLLETAGLAVGRRRRQGQAARADDAGRQARRRADPDRGQRVDEGAVADAGRDPRAAGLPALRHAAGRPLRRMEGARPQLHAAGFFARPDFSDAPSACGRSARNRLREIFIGPVGDGPRRPSLDRSGTYARPARPI